jgi:hypothetical protein
MPIVLTRLSVWYIFRTCREKTTTLSGGVPAVVSAQAWDGKDATIAVDEVPLDFMDE